MSSLTKHVFFSSCDQLIWPKHPIVTWMNEFYTGFYLDASPPTDNTFSPCLLLINHFCSVLERRRNPAWVATMDRGQHHYIDVIMTTMASHITSLTVVYLTVYSDTDQRKHQSSASLAIVWGPVNSPHKGQLRGKCFHLMTSLWPASSIRGIIDGSWHVSKISPGCGAIQMSVT